MKGQFCGQVSGEDVTEGEGDDVGASAALNMQWVVQVQGAGFLFAVLEVSKALHPAALTEERAA